MDGGRGVGRTGGSRKTANSPVDLFLDPTVTSPESGAPRKGRYSDPNGRQRVVPYLSPRGSPTGSRLGYGVPTNGGACQGPDSTSGTGMTRPRA